MSQLTEMQNVIDALKREIAKPYSHYKARTYYYVEHSYRKNASGLPQLVAGLRQLLLDAKAANHRNWRYMDNLLVNAVGWKSGIGYAQHIPGMRILPGILLSGADPAELTQMLDDMGNLLQQRMQSSPSPAASTHTARVDEGPPCVYRAAANVVQRMIKACDQGRMFEQEIGFEGKLAVVEDISAMPMREGLSIIPVRKALREAFLALPEALRTEPLRDVYEEGGARERWKAGIGYQRKGMEDCLLVAAESREGLVILLQKMQEFLTAKSLEQSQKR